MPYENEEKIKYTPETRIKEILQQIIAENGLTKEQLIDYYKNEFGYNFNAKNVKMMFKRDIKDLVSYKILWFNEVENSKLFTINRNFGFDFEKTAFSLSGIYTIFFFGFKKDIIGKDDVLSVINPRIFDYVGEYELDLD
ncbi:MAG: hypothetical protein WC141_04475 [Arcobacteraceae bacterium]